MIWDLSNFTIIAKLLFNTTRFYNDILSEEPTPRDFDEKLARKYLNRNVPKFVRALLKKQEQANSAKAFK